jgi:hypothetical protein
MLIGAAVEAFDPDCAVVTSNEYVSNRGGGPCKAGGWLEYLVTTGTIEEKPFP